LILLYGTVWQFFFMIVTHELAIGLSQHSRRSRSSKHCATIRISVSQISRSTKVMPQPQYP
jgi:hypothetical protein